MTMKNIEKRYVLACFIDSIHSQKLTRKVARFFKAVFPGDSNQAELQQRLDFVEALVGLSAADWEADWR